MKIGFFEIHRLRKHPVSGRQELPWDVLLQDLSPAAQAVIAKMARSEVKNYMAELAEKADLPFSNPVAFLLALRGMIIKSEEVRNENAPQPELRRPDGAPDGG